MSLDVRQSDRVIALLLGAAYVALLLVTSSDLGYARDEGFYFNAARSYGDWFGLLFSTPKEAMRAENINEFWRVNREHPAFIKSLFALSHELLFVRLGILDAAGTAYRFPGMVAGGVAVAVTYLWGKGIYGRLPGVVAALSLAMMPRVFYHAHLAAFDMPVTALWLVTGYAYMLAWKKGGWRWAVGAGLLYGLLLNTKHNGWLFPFAIAAHIVATQFLGRGWRAALSRHVRRTWRRRIRGLRALCCMVVLGPLVVFLLWPWLWPDPLARYLDYAGFHLRHDYYNMEFLGVTYWKPPFPLGYAWVMTLATIPLVTLLLFAIGLVFGVRHVWLRVIRPAPGGDVRARDFWLADPLSSSVVFWLLSILASYAPWLSSSTPIFGGTKHWMTSAPFLALFAGYGFSLTLAALRRMSGMSGSGIKRRHIPEIALATCVLVAPVVMTLHSHPFGLSAYTPVVGGASGAANLGLNRTFWGYTTGSVVDFLNERTPPNGLVYIHDTAWPSWKMLRADGRLRGDIRGTGGIENSDLALYHHEPHMRRVEYQIWVDYGTTRPAHIAHFDGVPVVWVYERSPSRLPSRLPATN